MKSTLSDKKGYSVQGKNQAMNPITYVNVMFISDLSSSSDVMFVVLFCNGLRCALVRTACVWANFT